MKNLSLILTLLISVSMFAQKGKPTSGIDSVLLDSNTLYQFINGQKQSRGSVVGNPDQSLFYEPVYGSYYSVASGRFRTGNGRWNVVIGEGAGDVMTNDANYNVFLGAHAGQANTTGDDNIFMGWDVGLSNTSGRGNVGFPQDALKYNTRGSDNLAIGKFSLYSNTIGSGNVGLGFNTMYYLDGGDENVSIGKYAGGIFKKGSGNVFIGRYAGETNQAETDLSVIDDAIAIGSYTGLSKMFSRTITIGNNLQPTAPNKINIGNVYKGDVSTGVAEVNSIMISGKKVTFDDNFMYVETSTGTKKVPLQDLNAPAAKEIVGFKAYNSMGQLLFYQPVYKN